MTAARYSSPFPCCRQYFRNRFMYRFANSGLITPPCGVPRWLLPRLRHFRFPSCSLTGAVSHILRRCNIRRSTIRRAALCISSACGIVSKETTTLGSLDDLLRTAAILDALKRRLPPPSEPAAELAQESARAAVAAVSEFPRPPRTRNLPVGSTHRQIG